MFVDIAIWYLAMPPLVDSRLLFDSLELKTWRLEAADDGDGLRRGQNRSAGGPRVCVRSNAHGPTSGSLGQKAKSKSRSLFFLSGSPSPAAAAAPASGRHVHP